MNGLERIYKSSFEAAHLIKGHPKCGVPHGHSYHLNVYFNGDIEVWVDFHDLKTAVDSFVQTKYDHQDLGDMTAEKIAAEIATYLQDSNYSGYLELFETEKFGVRLHFHKRIHQVENCCASD